MDPFTIASAIGLAVESAKNSWTAGEKLYLFIRDTQSVNKTVKDLADVVKAFGDTCDLVRASLETLAAAYTQAEGSFDTLQSKDDVLVWQGLQTRLQECQGVIDDLQLSMSGITKEHSNFVSQAWRQFKLNLDKEEMGGIQVRLQHHTSALSLSLQAIKIRVDHLIPRQADKDLLHELKQLRQFMQDEKASNEVATAQDELSQYAQAVFHDGATLYKSSVGDSTVVDDMETWTIMGDTSNNTSLERIQQWTEDLSALSLEQSSSLVSLESESILSGRPSLFSDDTSIDDGPSSFMARDEDRYADSDDELDIEIAKQTLSEGSVAFEKDNFEEATTVLDDAVKQLQQLPSHKRSTFDLPDLQYKLAVCAFHLDAPTRAAKRLVGFLQHSADTDGDRANICRAGHLLAQSYICLNKLDLARSTCESALRGRLRLLGRQHEEYHESMALMARVLELNGNAVRANSYLGLIPAEQRSTLKAKYAELRCPEKMPNVAAKPVTPERGRESVAHTATTPNQPYESPPTAKQKLASTAASPRAERIASPSRPSTTSNIDGPALPEERKVWLEALGWSPRDNVQSRLALGTFDIGMLDSRISHTTNKDTLLAMAALFGDDILVAQLIEAGANKESVHQVTPRYGYGGRTAVKAIHVAVAAKQCKVVQFLIEQGTALKSTGIPCISLLACLLHEPWLRLTKRDTAQHILSTSQALGLSAHTVDGSGMTLLHWSAKLPDDFSELRSTLVEHLLERGANVLKGDNTGATPLHLAAYSNSRAETVARLLRRRPLEQVHAMDRTGHTPLHWALGLGKSFVSSEVLRCLLDSGADIHFKRNVNADTPYSYAKEHHEMKRLDGETLQVLAFRGF